MRKMKLWELLTIIGVAVVLAVLLLPALAQPGDVHYRASCQNNLKQMGLVFKMYANESKGASYPPVSSVPGSWMVSMASIYPEYLTDPRIVICPNSPHGRKDAFVLKDNREHPGAKVGSFHPDCAAPLFYVYTGYELFRDEQARALCSARAARQEGLLTMTDINMAAKKGKSAAAALSMPRLKDSDRDRLRSSRIPTMWDRIGTAKGESNHTPVGSNVLYADGHVEFKKYGMGNKPDDFPVTREAAEIFGDSLPQRSRDCAD